MSTVTRRDAAISRQPCYTRSKGSSFNDNFRMEQVRERLGLAQDRLTCALNTADQTAQRPASRGKTWRESNDARDLRELLSRTDDYVPASAKHAQTGPFDFSLS